MSKYIIELDDRIKLVTSVGVTENGVVYTTSDYVHNLEELNSDYINEHYGELQDEAYQRGLEDAWEAAKKIFGYEIDGGIPIDKIGRVFGYSENETFCTADIIRHNTASEAIAKLKAYEEKQKEDDKIGAGDVVKTYNGITFVVTKATTDGIVVGFEGEGNTCRFALSEVTKTGEHYNINEILGGLSSDN